MKKLILPVFIALVLISCESQVEDNRTECQKENIGYVKFNNNSSNPYDIFINDVYYKQQPGNSISSTWIKFDAGVAYTIKVQQAAGYIIYPTVKTYNFTMNQCDEKTISFP